MGDKAMRIAGALVGVLFAAGGCVPRAAPTDAAVAVVTQTVGPINQQATVIFGVTFGRAVNGFPNTAAAVHLVHDGTAGGQLVVLPLDAQTYVVTVTGVTGDGTFQLSVPAGAALFSDGTPTPAGASVAIPVDNTPPQVAAITTQTPDGRYAAGAALDVTVAFTEPVTLSGGEMLIALNTGRTLPFPPFPDNVSSSVVYTVEAGDNAEPLDVIGIELADASQIMDAAGNAAALALPTTGLAGGHSLVVDTTAPAATVKSLLTNSLAKLSGTVNDAAASVLVSVAGASYAATNQGDGTWSLAGATEDLLPEGTYDVTLTATDSVGNAATTTAKNALTIDRTPPMIVVKRVRTYDVTPTLTGAVDDPKATVRVTVTGTTYTATNVGDGTWTLDGSHIDPPLENGTYDVAVEATDLAGNVAHDTTMDELVIAAP